MVEYLTESFSTDSVTIDETINKLKVNYFILYSLSCVEKFIDEIKF